MASNYFGVPWRNSPLVSDANGLNGQLPPPPDIAPPQQMQMPQMRLPPPPPRQLDPNSIRLAQQAMDALPPPPSLATQQQAMQTPSTWRSVLGGIVNSSRLGNSGLGDMIAYGPKGLQARQQMAAYQQGLPQRLQGVRAMADLSNLDVDNDRLERTAQANIDQSRASAGASEASAAASRAGVIPASGDFAQRMGVPAGTPVSATVAERGTRPTTPSAKRSPTDNDLRVIASGAMKNNEWGIEAETAKKAIDLQIKQPGIPLHYEVDDKGTLHVINPATKEVQDFPGVGKTKAPPAGAVRTGDLTDKEFTRMQQLGNSYKGEKVVGEFPAVVSSYQGIQDAAKRGDGIGDLTLLRYFAKLTDPSTGVREGEYDSMASALGALQKLGVAIQQGWWNGQQLTPTGRAAFQQMAKQIYDERQRQMQGTQQVYRDRAMKAGVDPTLVIADISIPDAPTQKRGKLTDPAVVTQYLQRAKGDKAEARKLAQADGWEF